MNLLQFINQRVPSPVKRFAKQFSRTSELARSLSPYLPAVICIDVGASYYPHSKWRLFLESPNTQWIAVEPNAANIGYIKTWRWPSKVSACTTGLSKEGGPHTLYITNVDSGSSLLEPHIPMSIAHRIRNLNYFFPMRTERIDTLSLMQVMADKPATAPVFVKLDTQGTELSILSGAQALINDRRIVGIELEATLLAQPIMQGAGKFWEACRYLEEYGFELLRITPIYGPSRLNIPQPRGHTFLNECDAVFALRHDVARGLAVEQRVGLLTFYLSNDHFEESLWLLENDAEMRSCLMKRGADVDKLAALIRAMA